MHKLHKVSGGTKKRLSSPVSRCFQGEMTVYDDTPVPGEVDEESGKPKVTTVTSKKPFL